MEEFQLSLAFEPEAEGKLKQKSYTVTLTLSKKRDIRAVEYLVKHLNRGAGGQRAARTKRKKGGKK